MLMHQLDASMEQYCFVSRSGPVPSAYGQVKLLALILYLDLV